MICKSTAGDRVETSNASTDIVVGKPDSPRLAVIHLLAWTTLVAVVAGYDRAIGPSEVVTPGAVAARNLLGYVLSATALGGLVIWLRRWWVGIPFPCEPGEWLLVITGIELVLARLVSPLLTPSIDRYWILSFYVWFTAVPYLWPFFRLRGTVWRWYFGFCVLIIAIYGAVFLSPYGQLFVFLDGIFRTYTAGTLFWFVAGMVQDKRRGRRRGWLHWVGLVVATCLLFTQFWE